MPTMQLLPALSTRVIVGRYVNLDGTPAAGEVVFHVSEMWRVKPEGEDAASMLPGRITAKLDSNGEFTAVVPCTTDPDIAAPLTRHVVVCEPGAADCRSIEVPEGDDPLNILDAESIIIVPPEQIGVALTGLHIGTVTTLPAGSRATASITGGPPEPDLNLGIPRGDRPEIRFGAITSVAPGQPPTAAWTGVGSVVDPYTLDLGVVRGDRPAIASVTTTRLAAGSAPTATWTGDGSVGSPYQLTLGIPDPLVNKLAIGTVAKGDDASATITGAAPDQTLNLVLPKGDKGDKGDPGAAGISNLNDPGVTGTLPISKGGTGATNATAARTALGIFQAKYAYFRSYQSSFVGSPRLAAFSRQTTGGAPADSSYSTPATANSRAGAITINETGLYAISAAWKASGEMGAATFGNIGVATQSAVDGAAGANRAVYPSECSMYTIGARSSDNVYISAAMSGVYLTSGLVLEFPTYNASSARSLEVLVTIAKVG